MLRIIHSLSTMMVALSTLVISSKGVVIDCYSTTGYDYDGNQQTSYSGKPCLRWDQFDYYTAADIPDATLGEAANYCRGARDHRPWCYISEYKEWDICGINKCGDDVLSECGQLGIETPTVLGRNVTFSFTPDTHDPYANLYWQRKNIGASSWSTLGLNFKYTQYQTNKTYYLVLTDSAKSDEHNYRVHYYNETMRCRMETKKLDLEGNACGLVQLGSKKVIRNGTVTIEYYPPNYVLANSENFERQWIHSNAQLQLKDGRYEEEQGQSDIYVLTIFRFNDSLSGKYWVNCGTYLRYTDSVTVEINEPPSLPLILRLQDIDSCVNCIVGEVGENFNVSCMIANGTRPLQVTMRIGNESHIPFLYNSTSTTYFVFFTLQDHHHMQNVSFSVMNTALSTPLQATVQVFVIKPPSIQSFSVPETLRVGEDVNITCITDGGRPFPIVYFDISGSKMSSSYMLTSSSQNKNLVSLNTFKREWNAENITCCRYNEWYKKKLECSPPKQVDYFFPPSNVRLEVKFDKEGQNQMYAVCTVHDSNPVCNVQFSAPGNIIGSERYSTNVSLPYGAWNAEYAVDLNVSKGDIGKDITCIAGCKEFYVDLSDIASLRLPQANEKEEYGKKPKSVSNKLVLWMILGSCLLVTGIIIAIVLFVVIRKRRQNPKEKKESRVSYQASVDKIRNSQHSPEDDLQGKQNVAAQDREGPEYSQAAKQKTTENKDNIYSQVNKFGSSEQQHRAEDGQLLYAELDFDANVALPKGTVVKRRDSPTEYANIDYVKTKAEKDNAVSPEESETIYANQ